jgi:hypothetical protein
MAVVVGMVETGWVVSWLYGKDAGCLDPRSALFWYWLKEEVGMPPGKAWGKTSFLTAGERFLDHSSGGSFEMVPVSGAVLDEGGLDIPV